MNNRTTLPRQPRTSRRLHVGMMVLAFGLTLLCSQARADHLDEALIKHSKKIMEDLRKHEYKQVAVLKFKLERSDGPSSYDEGLINANLANRLENALILANNPEQPIGITRNAGLVAAKAATLKEVGQPSTPEGRESLFKLAYPLAWGTDKVKVDAFLTGVVKLSADLKEIHVIVQAFDKNKAADVRSIATLTVPVDRSILSDLAQSFLVRRGINNSDETQDKEAIDSAASLDKQKPKLVNVNNTPVSDLVELKVYYDGTPVEFMANPARFGSIKLAEPKENQKVHFSLKNKSDKRLAVALRVNGRNTTVEDEVNLQPNEYTKWVIEPGKECIVDGFYSADGKSFKTFTVLPDDATAKEAMLNPALRGLIQMDVFAEGSKRENKNLFSARNISLRANSAPKADALPMTLAEARKQTMLATVNRKILPSSKGLIAPGSVGGSTDVQATTFENPTQVGSLVLIYYPKGL
jgi:hypothetical protein